MAPTPEPIPAGTVALAIRGDIEQEVAVGIAASTGLTVIILKDGQELAAMSEEDMGRAGWCRCPTPGFPIVPPT